ncbi:MAG TPA: lipoyl(octanoyl) transferase LipB [Chloroflexota bacterium]|nr:lipoyl(octanoyl) transferase LipB [Chloroflexota bacterium]
MDPAGDIPLDTRYLGRRGYRAAARVQADAVAARARGDSGDTAFLVEHDPVVTLGRSPGYALSAEQIGRLSERGVEIVETDRGGRATYHGPGQLVVYPVVSLRERGNDAHGYVRSLERLIIAWLATFGIEARVEAGLTGVWTDGGKIAAVGVGVRRGVGYHGFAVNLAPDLTVFELFEPCGLDGARVTSILRETGSAPLLEEAAVAIAPFIERFLGRSTFDRTAAEVPARG